jgi:hypothetical protein
MGINFSVVIYQSFNTLNVFECNERTVRNVLDPPSINISPNICIMHFILSLTYGSLMRLCGFLD